MALDEGAVLVQLSRAVFVSFLAERPKALQIYLEQGVSRLWRVANFMLSDYLAVELPHGQAPRSGNGEVQAAPAPQPPSAPQSRPRSPPPQALAHKSAPSNTAAAMDAAAAPNAGRSRPRTPAPTADLFNRQLAALEDHQGTFPAPPHLQRPGGDAHSAQDGHSAAASSRRSAALSTEPSFRVDLPADASAEGQKSTGGGSADASGHGNKPSE
jgi:hypothetical protein